jgi:hypothetical protein
MTDEELDAMSDGNFYHYMLSQDHREWARQANRRGGFGFNPDQEDCLATWFANVMCAVIDRPNADYIRVRLDSEHREAHPAAGERKC